MVSNLVSLPRQIPAHRSPPKKRRGSWAPCCGRRPMAFVRNVGSRDAWHGDFAHQTWGLNHEELDRTTSKHTGVWSAWNMDFGMDIGVKPGKGGNLVRVVLLPSVNPSYLEKLFRNIFVQRLLVAVKPGNIAILDYGILSLDHVLWLQNLGNFGLPSW